MRKAIRKPVAIIGCGILALGGGVAYAASGGGAAESGSAVAAETTAGAETTYVYRSSIQRDLINVRDAKGAFAPYKVSTTRRLETWTAPDGGTLTRQTCLVARNPEPQNGGTADPSKGQACQTMEFRMSRAELDIGGLLGSDATGIAGRLGAFAGPGASFVQLASLAASVALNPAATAEQRKAAEAFIVGKAGGAQGMPNGAQSADVSGSDGSVGLEFDPMTGEVNTYHASVADPAGQALSDRAVTQIATVSNEGEVPAP